jgi:2-polyprenyl-3-methyl-5-hydroxy-6-metoxy-1,4-benzoquinol methylase
MPAYEIGQLGEIKLRPAHDLAITYDALGQTIAYNFARPERCARVSEKVRVLLGCFPPIQARCVEAAIEVYCRQSGEARSPDLDAQLLCAVNQLAALGFLVAEDDSGSSYTQSMVEHYVQARIVPPEVCDTVTRAGNVGSGSRVLDVATGTGSVALQLAARSQRVTGIDLCEPFLRAAREMAASSNLKVDFRRGCGNQLVFDRAAYDVITVSQAYHWLDPLSAMRGFLNALAPGGCLFFIESNAVLPRRHPIRRLWGYGKFSPRGVEAAFRNQAKSYSLRAQGVRKVKWELELSGRWLFRQTRPFDSSFARALFHAREITTVGGCEVDSWKKLLAELDAWDRDALRGEFYWQVIRFQKVARPLHAARSSVAGAPIQVIPYAPSAGILAESRAVKAG